MAGKVISWSVFGLLTVLAGYMVVAAVGNLLLLPEMGASLGLQVNAVGWGWLWAGVALPVVTYALALVVARGRSVWVRVLITATALAVTAAFQLEIMHLVPQSSFFM